MRIVIGLFLALVLASSCLGQTTPIPPRRFSVYRTSTLVAAAEKITIQQPATGSKRIILEWAWLDCSVSCTVTFSVRGTAATGTALARNALFTDSGSAVASATATAWHTSDVGAGTAVSPAMTVNPGAPGQTYDLTGYVLQGNGTTTNLTMTTSAITGTAKIMIQWREE